VDQLTLWAAKSRTAHWGDDADGTATPRHMTHWLEQRLGRPVGLVFTKNRSTMLSCKNEGPGLRLRLHEAFVEAPEFVWDALASFVDDNNHDAGAAGILDSFVALIPRPEMPAERNRPQGRFFNLQAIFDELNEGYFHRACRAQITWGTAGARRRRSIQLGSYVSEDRLIRLHPCLDQAFVPPTYVGWIVFHEMLHEVFGVEGKGPHSIHTPEFKAIESIYPGYDECMRWEKANLDKLLCYRPEPG